MEGLRKQIISDGIPYGCYVWEMPDGRWVGDEDGNYAVSRLCMRGDKRAMGALRDLVKSCGIEVGRPIFLENRRPVSDEEYEEQLQRMKWGLTPDPLDISEVRDK